MTALRVGLALFLLSCMGGRAQADSVDLQLSHIAHQCMAASSRQWPQIRTRVRQQISVLAPTAQVDTTLDALHALGLHPSAARTAILLGTLILQVEEVQCQPLVQRLSGVSEAEWPRVRRDILSTLAAQSGLSPPIVLNEKSATSILCEEIRRQTRPMDAQAEARLAARLWRSGRCSVDRFYVAQFKALARQKGDNDPHLMELVVARVCSLLQSCELGKPPDEPTASEIFNILRDANAHGLTVPMRTRALRQLHERVHLARELCNIAANRAYDLSNQAWENALPDLLDSLMMLIPKRGKRNAAQLRARLQSILLEAHTPSRDLKQRENLVGGGHDNTQATFKLLNNAIRNVAAPKRWVKQDPEAWGPSWPLWALGVLGLVHPLIKRGYRATARRMPRWTRWLPGLTVNVVFWLICLELMARYILSSNILYTRIAGDDTTSRSLRYLRIHKARTNLVDTNSIVGWLIRPGLRNLVYENKLVDSNSRGLRGREEYTRDIPFGTTRVMMVGDSFTFGVEAGNDATISYHLQACMKAPPEGNDFRNLWWTPRVQVLNLGEPGYGLDQELLRYETEGVRYRADVVVLNYVCLDAARDEVRFTTGAKPMFEYEDGRWVVEGIPIPHRDVTRATINAQWRLVQLIRILTAAGSVDYVGFNEARTTAILDRLREDVERAGAKLVVIYLPISPELTDQLVGKDEFIRAWCERNHVPFHSVLKRMEAGIDEGTVRPVLDSPFHYTSSEANVVAHDVAHFLVRQNLVSATVSGKVEAPADNDSQPDDSEPGDSDDDP